MLNQNLILELREFGLTEYESRAYIILTMYGSSIASFISEHTRIPSSKIYDILNSLKAKGLVEICSTKPKRFKAIEPKHALNNIIEKREFVASQLRMRANNILSKLTPLEEKDNSQIWSSTGKKIFIDKICELFRGSKENITFVTGDFPRNPHLDEEFLKAIKRGVKVRILGVRHLTEESKLKAEWYAKNGADIRVIPLDVHSSFAINEKNELVFKVNSKIECDFIWTRNIPLVNILGMYFEHCWIKADFMQLY